MSARLITGGDELPGWIQPQPPVDEDGGATGVSPVQPGGDARLSTGKLESAPAVITRSPH